MTVQKLKKAATRNLANIPGWRTNRKIVVFESDDWGTIRMGSRASYEYFKRKGYPLDVCPYNRFDALESNADLEGLFEVLSSVKDKHGRPAKFTANNNVANPDFDRIREEDFEQYSYEVFTATLKRYPQHDRVVELYQTGIVEGLFRPQYHSREHLNIDKWMKALQFGVPAVREAFDRYMFDVRFEEVPTYSHYFMYAFDTSKKADLERHKRIIREGARLFEELWGYPSKSFIAPGYVWHRELEQTLLDTGVNYIQGLLFQLEPVFEPGEAYHKRLHLQGQKNKLGQRYLVRNAFFEPSFDRNFDWVSDVLSRMRIAFRWNKPAVICTHRLNYIGFIDPANRDRNLNLLSQLLQSIVRNWPDVEFASSDELGDVM